MRKVFLGRDGLRAGWSLLIFFAVTVGLIVGLQNVAVRLPLLGAVLENPANGDAGPEAGILNEVIYNIAMLVAMLVMARIERRRVLDYGWAPNPGARLRLLLGFLLGIAMFSSMYFMQWLEHVYKVEGFALNARAAFLYGTLWLVTCLLIGTFEEGVFRGYAQSRLGRAVGFWPAALIVSVVFGSVHMVDTNYHWMGTISATMGGLFFCFCLWRTGDLWLAVGFHAAGDFTELFVFAPAHSFRSAHHLLKADSVGPAWLTGSTIGPEASIHGYLLMAVAFVLVAALTRKAALAK